MASSIKSGSLAADQSISTGQCLHASSNAIFNGAMGSSSTWALSPGDDSARLNSFYDLSDGVSATEKSSATTDQIGITNSRSIAGTGNMYAFQGYSGSNDYSGSSSVGANEVSGTIESNAALTPTTLSASQVASLSGDSADVGLSLDHQGDSIYMSSGIGSGTITTSQDVWTGSVHGSQKHGGPF